MRRITCVSDGGTIEVAARTTRLAPFPLWESGRAGAITRPFSTSRASTVLSANEKPDLQPLPPWLSHQGALSAVSQQPCEPLKKKLPFCSQLRRHTLVTSSSRRRVLSALSPLRCTYSIHGADPLLLHSRDGGQSACRGRRGEQDNGRIRNTHLR